MEDGDEPYSPGGSDTENNNFAATPEQTVVTQQPPFPIVPATAVTEETSSNQLDQDEIQRKMDELTRQIEAQKMEIAGMLQTDVVHLDEPYSPTSLLGSAAASASTKRSIPALAEISIPSNLQEILNSINKVSVQETASNDAPTLVISDSDEEYTPTASTGIPYESSSAGYIPSKKLLGNEALSSAPAHLYSQTLNVQEQGNLITTQKEPSKLAQLTDEELLSMVPDDIRMESIPLPKRSSNTDAGGIPSVAKKTKYHLYDPPPPGLEEEYVP